jgi:hypothetical protein
MEVKQSTFGDVSTHYEQSETQTETPTAAVETSTETQTTTEQTTTEPPQEQPTPEPQQEENSSSFNISVSGDEQKTDATEPTQQPTFNLDEEIKKIDRKELLKKAGVNDFAIELDEYLSKGGRASDYLGAKSIDYNDVSDEELIKSDYKKQYPNFTNDEINRLFQRKYGITELMTDDEQQDKLLELKADGYSRRQSKIQEQQSFKIPETPILQTDEAYEQWKQNKESQSKLFEQVRSYYENHEATKSLYESKRVAVNLGENVPPFNFNVDKPEVLTQMFTDDGSLFNKATSTQTGEPDVRKRQLIGLFSFNPDKFVKDIFNYGQQIGKRSMVEEGQNAQRPQAKVLPADFNQAASYGVGKFGDRQR